MKTSKMLLLITVLTFSASVYAQHPVPSPTNKPAPKFEQNSFCPEIGKTSSTHNDPVLNKAKNRIDDAATYFQVDFDALENLEKPNLANVGKKKRSTWSQADRDLVAKYEGVPVWVEGYLVLTKMGSQMIGAKPEGAELCNCQMIEPEHIDFHLWLVKTPDSVNNPASAKPDSIVVEITPRVRSHNPNWTVARLTQIANSGTLVRVSGWLTFDQEHPEQIGVHRHNLWEVHPITKFEYKDGNTWKAL
jgi:hypothetical protein